MAKKKGGFGRFLGAITGSPYERLQKQIDKVVSEAGSDKALAKTLKKLVKAIGQQYDEGNIDEEEHDLLIEGVEDVDPDERDFPKLTDDGDAFYDDGDMRIGRNERSCCLLAAACLLACCFFAFET